MQSDPWWSVAMAINVFLVFFFGFRPDFFQRYLWVYCLICYGMPCIAGMLFLIYRHPTKGLIYGDAIVSGPLSTMPPFFTKVIIY